MPHLQVHILEGPTEEQKERLAKELIAAAQRVLGMGDDSYSVSIQGYPMEDWKNEVYPKTILGHPDILYKKPGYTM